nr:AP-5 complex subunit mu [Ipomoea batatas]
MTSCCSIRAFWIISTQDTVLFSRRFPVVEKRWRAACQRENENLSDKSVKSAAAAAAPSLYLPTDSEIATAFTERKNREGSARGFGVRVNRSVEGSDSWVDDPIMRHIISLIINKVDGVNHFLWPLIMHIKGHYCVLVLPLVEPHQLRVYSRMCKRADCGNSIGADENLSSLLLDLPSITGAFMVAHMIGDVITGDVTEPEIVISASPSVGGLLDSLTGSIGISGISARAKPVASPAAAPTVSSSGIGGAMAADGPKIGLRPLDKDAVRSFISSAMPFGTPLDLNYTNISSIKINGFSSTDMPPTDSRQPAWKPYLYRGKQRILFTIHETVHAAMYDRDEIPDSIKISGQVNCRAELEGLPDVMFPLTGLDAARLELLSFHPCAQVPEHSNDKQALMFSPPLGNFVLMRYQAFCRIGPPIKGFYQLSMVSENEGAFLFKLCLMEGYKAPLSMDFCSVTMPFPRRRVVSFDGTPSLGTVSITEHSVEWKIITTGRGVSGKSVEATFPGTVKFAPWQTQSNGTADDEDDEIDSTNNTINVEDFLMEKMSKDLQAVELEEPFCWQAYDYTKVSFKIMGGSLSGMTIDPKSVTIFPTVKAPVEFSTQVTSGDYILWNTLGKCPVVATPKA